MAPLLIWLFATVLAVKAGAAPQPINADTWAATAYCKGKVTYSGIPVKRGMAASDPKFLPLGSVIRVYESGHEHFDGIYTVVDTGPEIQGRELDLYMWSCYEALDFGRRPVKIEVIRLGWMPNDKVTK